MLAHVFNDDPDGESCGTPFPLLRTINSVLTRLAASPNELFTFNRTYIMTRQSFVNTGPKHSNI